jgi:K+-sensing histidine kinase KdpD
MFSPLRGAQRLDNMRTLPIGREAPLDDQHTPKTPGEPEAGSDGARPAYLGFIAHEIRNPMSTALWTAELLGRLSAADRAGARGEKLVALCFRSLTKVRLLVEDHLLCERLDAGGYPIRVERLILAEVVEAVASKQIGDNPPLERQVPPELAVLADRILLERALDGLVGACGREAAAVRLTARAAGDRVLVRVAGGPVASLDDPHKGAPSDQRGRALALPTSRRAAAAFGAHLAVEGEGYLLSIPSA